LGETRAYLARELACNGSPDAKPQCDRLAADTSLPINAHFLLANAYMLLHEFDAAAEVCNRGLRLELDVSETDFEVIEAFTRDRQRLQDYLGTIERGRNRQGIRWMLDQAVAHIRQDRFADALPLLQVALREAPNDDEVFHLQGQCHLGMNMVDEAYADLAEFRRRGGDAETADRLQCSIDAGAAEVQRFGHEALRLRAQAAESFARRNCARANELLLMALAVCSDGGRKSIEEQKAMVMLTMAVDEFQRVFDDHSQTAANRLAVCKEAVQWLEEARRLDTQNAAVERNLRSLRDVISHIEPTTVPDVDETPGIAERSS
jgi:tetratricopeptide (TPR) repeat protein